MPSEVPSEGFLAAIQRDLEPLRGAARDKEKPRQRALLVEAAPCIHEALKDGVAKETVFKVLAQRGYRGTRESFFYFVKRHLERELIRQGITPEGWTLKSTVPTPGDGAQRQTGTVFVRKPRQPRVHRGRKPSWTPREPAAGQRERSSFTVFKPGAQRQASEFEQRLAEAVRQRRARGEWQNV